MDDEGIAEVYHNPIPPEEEKAALQAADNCPVSVITVDK
jgi:ferredoxin